MKRRSLLIATLLPAAAASVMAAPDLAQSVRERLQQPEWLRGDFTQTKRVPGFAKPLVSSGNFVAARGRGVLWRTLKPFASELRLTQNEIRASQGGQTSMRLDASREPAVRLITTLMFALLNGDVSSLAELFELSGGAQGASWQLSLVPKRGPLQQVLKKVEVEGDGFVRRIQLYEANGDESLIQIQNPRTEGAAEPGLFQ
ncbi:outer membrane lipoprotein carrier protein LolA [Pelomonas sp. V22]|uniref:LolA family protein n=1 Tax=Pelomonas sp. V22 TaxID=2822139 RepID=UPI0024A7B2DA|nr:outer membrane lipoprotein carrier protein LolA [Pelomonas sp. V22]MDI4635506.1 outer membrane lipoprotein carrier protein LolA [Pelomonas sp. V22]